MDERELYLKRNVQIEPLVDQWYAWSHLIPPATYARNLTERHLKIMDSFINAPGIHSNAVKNPKMLGGPFIDYGADRVGEIQALRNRTRCERVELIELSKAVATLDETLQTATGTSLLPFYSKIPDVLRGYVELYYDARNHASFRVIEPLLYRSRFYRVPVQSLMLSLTNSDGRPFVLSTPRIHGPDRIELSWRFSDERVDRLIAMKQRPQSWSSIRDLLSPSDDQLNLLRSFFTTKPPRACQRYRGCGLRWRYFGHACILVETADISVLTDPVISYTYESDVYRYTFEDLPDHIDYVLITHNHQDHILFETILQLRDRIGTVLVPSGGSGTLIDPSLRLILENAGFRRVRELREMETLGLSQGYEITGIPFLGEHSDLAISTKIAYHLRIGEYSVLFAADSCNIAPDLYKHIHEAVGNVTVLFLGMECDGAPLSWLYGPLIIGRIDRACDESRRLSGCNYEQAMQMLQQFNCRHVYVYAMGQEPWLTYIMSLKYTPDSRPIVESNRLVNECVQMGIFAERLFGEKEILVEGGAVVVHT